MHGNNVRKWYCLPLFLLAGLLTVCSNDLLGLLRSNDLDERLQERDNFHFVNAEKLNWGDEYSFIIVSDTHIENKNAFGLEKLKEVIAKDDTIKFVVVNGDITQNGAEEDMQKFLEIARSFSDDTRRVPCYPVIGNHDIYFDNWEIWKKYIGSTRYQIDDGDSTTLFILDTANAYFGRAQLKWLESEIKSANSRVFVFTHANLFVKHSVKLQQLTDPKERARVCSILRGRAEAMFTGHSHARDERTVDGVQYITIDDFVGKRVYCTVTVKRDSISYKYEKL